jgi:hypothetical protein
MAEHPNWTQRGPIVCPDCGEGLGSRSLSGEAQILLRVGFTRCPHKGRYGGPGPACPRVQEAMRAAEAMNASLRK